MNPSTSSVAIIVVTFNSEPVIGGFLDSIPDGLDGVGAYELIVVDNASHDRTLDVVAERRPAATIVALASNRGYSAGINAGVAAASGSVDAILVVNDDIRFGPGSVARMLEALDPPHVGVVVPRLVDGEGALLLSQRRMPTVGSVWAEAVLGGARAQRRGDISEIVGEPSRYAEHRSPDWASGCAWLIAGSTWEAVGTWDESLFLYAEDLEYAQRVRAAGSRLHYTPEAEVTHLVGPSHQNPRLWAMLVLNRYRVFRRSHGWAESALFWLGLVVNEAIRSPSSAVHRAGLAALVWPPSRPVEVR